MVFARSHTYAPFSFFFYLILFVLIYRQLLLLWWKHQLMTKLIKRAAQVTLYSIKLNPLSNVVITSECVSQNKWGEGGFLHQTNTSYKYRSRQLYFFQGSRIKNNMASAARVRVLYKPGLCRLRPISFAFPRMSPDKHIATVPPLLHQVVGRKSLCGSPASVSVCRTEGFRR